MSGNLPENPDFLPSRNVRGKGVRRLTRFPLLAVFAVGVMFFLGVIYTAYMRSHHNEVGAGGTKKVASAEQSAASLLAGEPSSGAIRPKLNQEAAGAPAPAAAVRPIGPARTTTGSTSAEADPRETMIRQAWLDYIQGLIQAQAHREDAESSAATAPTAVSLPSGTGTGATGAVGRPETVAETGSGAPGANAGLPLTSGGKATGGQPIVPSIGLGGVPGLGYFGGVGGGYAGGGNGNDPNGQAGKAAYLGNLRGNPDYLATGRSDQISPDTLRAGSVIPAVMIGGVDSDLPGQIIAQLSENVYDTATGRILLIPQGTRLVGTYDNGITMGQTRVLVAWTRLIYPDGSSLDIGSMPGADQEGFAGFHDEVNNHYFRIFGDALLMSLFSAGIQLSQPNSTNNNSYSSQQIIAGALGQQLGEAGIALIQRDMGIAPTLVIRPGYRFNVMVTRDMVIRPWEG